MTMTPEARASIAGKGGHSYGEATVARMRVLWDAGVTCLKIGAELNLTKNQVIGLVHRQGFPPRANPIKFREATKRPRSHEPDPKPIKLASMARVADMVAMPSRAGKLEAANRRGRIGMELVQRVAPAPAPVAYLRQSKFAAPPAFRAAPGEGCRYIVDDTKRAVRFCDDARLPGRPYCGTHFARCYARAPGMSVPV